MIPCKSLAYASSMTNASRSHIVMMSGTYVETGGEGVHIGTTNNSPTGVHLHGHGAVVTGNLNQDGQFMVLGNKVSLRDLDILLDDPGIGSVLVIGGTEVLLERIKLQGGTGLTVSGSVIAKRLQINGENGSGIRLESDARLELDGALIKHTNVGIASVSGIATFSITNALIYDSGGLSMNLRSTGGGTISFSTIVAARPGTMMEPAAIRCGNDLGQGQVTIRSSIIWAPMTGPAIQGCLYETTIVGPTSMPGASNADPMFVDLANDNYHLQAASPARDSVVTGPSTDFEGDARPNGVRFDLGADEVK